MKLDSAEPDSEPQEDIGNERVVELAGDKRQPDKFDSSMNHHDVRASLAIINGYSAALESSFKELRDLYNKTVDEKDGFADETSSARLMTLEADCRFCLSRMCSSVEKLKERLQKEDVLQISSQD